jgi:hypothetical protein
VIHNLAVTRDVQPVRPPAQADPQPEYPSLMLNEAHLSKLGFKELPPVGTPLKMVARVEVTGSMMHDGQNGKERMLHLKISHMIMGKGNDLEQTDSETKTTKLYGAEKES